MFVIICSTGVLASGDRNYPEMAKIQTGNQNGKAYAKLLREQREDISLASDERMRFKEYIYGRNAISYLRKINRGITYGQR